MARKDASDPRRHYIREWRKHRSYTQKDVCARLEKLAGEGEMEESQRLPTTEASLSRIENQKQPYTQAILEALSEIYRCDPDDLLGRDPTKEGKVVDFMKRATPAQLRQLEKMIEVLSTGTDG